LFRSVCDEVAWSRRRNINCLVEPVAVFGAESKFFVPKVLVVEGKLELLCPPGITLAGFRETIEPLTV
jgi:hypothetical protein